MVLSDLSTQLGPVTPALKGNSGRMELRCSDNATAMIERQKETTFSLLTTLKMILKCVRHLCVFDSGTVKILYITDVCTIIPSFLYSHQSQLVSKQSFRKTNQFVKQIISKEMSLFVRSQQHGQQASESTEVLLPFSRANRSCD